VLYDTNHIRRDGEKPNTIKPKIMQWCFIFVTTTMAIIQSLMVGGATISYHLKSGCLFVVLKKGGEGSDDYTVSIHAPPRGVDLVVLHFLSSILLHDEALVRLKPHQPIELPLYHGQPFRLMCVDERKALCPPGW